ncbi:MFS transporter, partial [Ameyamaea chiangmaiensis]
MASVLSRPPVVTTMLSALYFLLMAGTFNSLGVVLPMMVRDIGLSWTQAGFGFTLLGVSCGVSSLLPALTIRRLGVSLTLIMGGLLLCAGFASLALARGTGIYDLGTILLGVGFCFAGSVPATHVIATLYARPGSALGMYFAIGGLGSVSGPLLFYVSALLLSGWRPFWGMAAVASLLAGLGAAACTRVVPHRVERATDDIGPVAVARWTPRAAIRTPQLWIVIASYTASLTVNTTIHSFAVQHLGERGLSLGRAATLFSVAALIGAGASAIAGRLGE